MMKKNISLMRIEKKEAFLPSIVVWKVVNLHFLLQIYNEGYIKYQPINYQLLSHAVRFTTSVIFFTAWCLPYSEWWNVKNGEKNIIKYWIEWMKNNIPESCKECKQVQIFSHTTFKTTTNEWNRCWCWFVVPFW